ncbi:MAG TPA: DUF4349 domain-containing protein, partial [Bacteroidetes bacterium]|nr:DUF4349 domain-containing protein [Bacteroidota bacterium]
IEVAEGRLRFLSDRVSLSTISLTFYEDRPIEAVAEAGSGFGQRVKIAFLRGWQGIQWGLLALAYLWPLILLTVLFFIVRKKIFLRHKRPQTQA